MAEVFLHGLDIIARLQTVHGKGMAEIMEKLDRAGVNIKYSYAYALGSGAEAILVFSFDDNAKAEAALA